MCIGTFKLKKNELRVEGYDPALVERAASNRPRRIRTNSGPGEVAAPTDEPCRPDALLYLDVAANVYRPLTPAVYEQIRAGAIKF